MQDKFCSQDLLLSSCGKTGRRQKRRKKICEFSPTNKAFPYICISPNSAKFCSQDLLKASATSLQSCLQVNSSLQNTTWFPWGVLWVTLGGGRNKEGKLENKTICLSWNQTLYGERPKYWGSIFSTESSEENWHFCADIFCTCRSTHRVNRIQDDATSSMVEPCSEGLCHLCFSQSLLRTLLFCDKVVLSASSQVTSVKSKEETRSMGTAAASAAVGQATPTFCWHN